MTTQELTEVYYKALEHPNPDILVFKINGEWIKLKDLETLLFGFGEFATDEDYVGFSELQKRMYKNIQDAKTDVSYIEQGHDFDLDNKCESIIKEIKINKE